MVNDNYIQLHFKTSKTLKPSRAVVLSYIISLSRYGDEKFCYAGIETIAEHTCCSENTVSNILDWLELNEYITIESRKLKNGATTSSARMPTQKAYDLIAAPLKIEAKLDQKRIKEERKKLLETELGRINEQFRCLKQGVACFKNAGLDSYELTRIIEKHTKFLRQSLPRKLKKDDVPLIANLFQ